MFVLLVVATVGAFFAAQALKHGKPLLRYRASTEAFSPNGDGVKDTARIRFKLPEGDDVTVTVLDADGGRVARIADNQHLGKGEHTLVWDGRTGDGLRAPEDDYRVRVGLRRHGRTNLLPHTVTLDLTPPRPHIRRARGPIVIDGFTHRFAVAEVGRPGRDPRFSLWRTDLAKPKRVLRSLPLVGKHRARWDGRLRGRLAPPGTYLIAASAVDRAGNRGSVPDQLPPPAKGTAQGGVGVTIRPLAVKTALTPVTPGARARVRVEAGGRKYTWALHRTGGGREDHGRSRSSRLSVRIPDGPAGTYTVTVRSHRRVARAVIPVSAPRPRPILVVLPALTWQGRNDTDDDGDGLPDSLARGRESRIDRPFAYGRLPRGFRSGEERVLSYLDGEHLRYELTTDLALARTGAAQLRSHPGVILAGDTRWLTEQLGERLRAYVQRGGKVLSLGTDSLLRTVALGARTMSDPSERKPLDFLGADVEPLEHSSTSVTATSDRINVFRGSLGNLGTYDAWEPTKDVGSRGRLVATAIAGSGEKVFVAYRLGRGLVFRPGVRGWGRALEDPIGAPAATTRRIWTLLHG